MSDQYQTEQERFWAGEFGANIGLNLMALRQLLPEADLSAIEINRKAVESLRRLGGGQRLFPVHPRFLPRSPARSGADQGRADSH